MAEGRKGEFAAAESAEKRIISDWDCVLVNLSVEIDVVMLHQQ